MTANVGICDKEEQEKCAEVYEIAYGFVPRIRALASGMEQNRRLDDDLLDDMEKAGLFALLVPRRWGGFGLGAYEANRVVEILGAGDCSTAWVCSFYILHNWFACRLPMDVQQQLYSHSKSIRSAAVFGPPTDARRVDGGYLISGKWGYASGILHAAYCFVPAMVDGVIYWFLVPKTSLVVHDDWFMGGMSATGSCSVAADNLFVPSEWCASINEFMGQRSVTDALHDEAAQRYPFTSLLMVSPSAFLGALDYAVASARERLEVSRPMGVARITRSASRIRWASAYQQARVLRLVRDDATHEAMRLAERGVANSLEIEARAQLHNVAFVNGIKDTLRSLLDGLGSSAHAAHDPIRRMASDCAAFATHALGPDIDSNMDRYARWVMGLGLDVGDPAARIA